MSFPNYSTLTHWLLCRPWWALAFHFWRHHFWPNWNHLYSTSAGGKDLSYNTQTGVSIRFEVGSWLKKNNRLYEDGAVRPINVGGSGGMLPQKILKSEGSEMPFQHSEHQITLVKSLTGSLRIFKDPQRPAKDPQGWGSFKDLWRIFKRSSKIFSC